ncbi:MAG: PilT/PilU family type 4a pilus ATPase [Candidatus Falkowbacteria bacterium]
MNINKLLKTATLCGASDLHIVKGMPPIVRIDGELLPLDMVAGGDLLGEDGAEKISANIKSLLADGKFLKDISYADYSDAKLVTDNALEKMVNDMLTKEQKTRFLAEKDLDFGYSVEDRRYRVNLSHERDSFRLSARVISDIIPTLDNINMPDVIYNLLSMNQGLVLLTGPTGCGKSTTLASMVEYLNKNFNYNIITLEDPIEYLFKSDKSVIAQRQLGFDMLTFGDGLKHILRQDPDVVMVGEMRDLETIATAITLAETGHLVLATLHTYSAAQTVDRMIDIFPPHQQGQIRSQLSMILAAVISQRLLPKAGGGRVAAREIMIRNSAVANLIREQKTSQLKSVIETSYKDGMRTLSRSIKELYDAELITRETAELALNDPAVGN